jgi:hypothetical protein
MTFRYAKSERTFECPRLSHWQHHQKRLLIATLADAFWFSLLNPQLDALRNWLLHPFGHRNGKRSWETPTPLDRLRFAISLFWLSHPPP